MTSKGKKDKGGTATAAVVEPPEREVVPGKITENQWLELLCGEESSVVAGEVVEGLVGLAFAMWQDHYLEQQSFPNTVQEAKTSLLQIIEWEFLQRDEGESNPGNDPSWLEDDEPVCSVIDSWARGMVPQSSEVSEVTDEDTRPPSDTSTAADEGRSQQSVTAATPPPQRDSSRQPTRASTVDSYSTNTTASRLPVMGNTAHKVSRLRPQARRPQARLVALTQPQSEVSVIPPESETAVKAPSPAHSHTPTMSPISSPHPPPLPYNMKPAQLRWQKNITYDSSGKIVDMVRLEPSHFPSHRVRPRVRVSHPTTSHSHKHPPNSHSSPHSLPHTSQMSIPVKSGGTRKEGTRRKGAGVNMRDGVTRQGQEMQRKRSSRGIQDVPSRFPDTLTLPSLVDTIDPSAGVCVTEGNRSVHGPPGPRRPPHFLLPHTTMMPLHSPPVSPGTAVTTGDAS